MKRGNNNGRFVTVLKFTVLRKHRQAVRDCVKTLKLAHVQEVCTFKDSTFTLTEIGPEESENLEFVKDAFKSISITEKVGPAAG